MSTEPQEDKAKDYKCFYMPDIHPVLEEINETINYANYHANPIGPPTDLMFQTSRREVIKDMKDLKDQFKRLCDALGHDFKD